MTRQEYFHNSVHSQMACGPMESCHLCNQGIREAPEPFITSREIAKGIILAMLGAIAVEVVVRRWLLKAK